MNAVIAKISMFGQRSGEDRFEIILEIGTPYQCGDRQEEWACPVALSPLYERLCDMRGVSSFQALCLAIALAQELLADFKEKGGSLTFETGEEFPLQAYSCGLAARRGIAQHGDQAGGLSSGGPAT